MCWTVVVMCGFGCAGSCTSPCAVLAVGDASGEPGWSLHTLWVVLRKEKLFRGTTVPPDCVCVSNHAATGQAATWEWEKATSGSRASETVLSLGVNHSCVIGKKFPKLFLFSSLYKLSVYTWARTPRYPISLGSANWFKEMSWPKVTPFLLPESAKTKSLLVN